MHAATPSPSLSMIVLLAAQNASIRASTGTKGPKMSACAIFLSLDTVWCHELICWMVLFFYRCEGWRWAGSRWRNGEVRGSWEGGSRCEVQVYRSWNTSAVCQSYCMAWWPHGAREECNASYNFIQGISDPPKNISSFLVSLLFSSIAGVD